jgi:class 3 adenylate cyclase
MRIPETSYATTRDGASIAYQTAGDGPIDLAVDLAVSGNVEMMWGFAPVADLLERLSGFARVILHDRRGTGLSGGGALLPDLETRAQDLLAVLDACGSTRPALFGTTTGGAALAVFAASHPDHVSSFVWHGPIARTTPAPGYPWGERPEARWHSLTEVLGSWGTTEMELSYLEDNAPTHAGDERLASQMARLMRHFMAPSTAVEFIRVWNETDVRDALGALRCPTLLTTRTDNPHGTDEARSVQTMIPGAELELLPGRDFPAFFGDRAALVETIRSFLGIARPHPIPDTILSTVLFTDIVGSTEKQASLGDKGWKDLVEQHHAVVRDALARWRGVENDTAGDGFYATFDGPARAINCALEIAESVRDLGVEVRAGVHIGECELIESKCGGLTVSIGARVAAKAGPSEVLVSRTVKDLTAGSGLVFEDTGEHELKGVPDRWRLYRVVGT